MRAVLAAVRGVQTWFLGALMLAMSFAYGLNVAVRGLMPSIAPQFAWIDEVCLFGLVWMVFLALSLGLEGGRHIGMRMLLTQLPPGLQRAIKLAVNVIGVVFCLYLTRIGIDITVFVANSGQASPTLNISMAWLYWVMPVGFGLLAIGYLVEIFTPADRYAIELDPTHHL